MICIHARGPYSGAGRGAFMDGDSQEQLMAWVRGVSDAEVSFDAPSTTHASDAGIGLYLLEMRGDLPLSPARPDTRQLELAYLVTTWADSTDAASKLLVDLCFAAMDEHGLDVDLEPPDTGLWQALGVPPQPAFRVNVPLRRSRILPETRPVLRPLMIKSAGLISITGAVRTPSDTAVPEARVEIPLLGRAATTDRAGEFRLDGIPDDRRPVRIRVRARGREVTRDIGGEDDRSYVVITIDPTEALHG